MKAIFASLLLATTVVAPAMAADPLEGVWKTEVDGEGYAHVEISPCGEGFCGVVVETFDPDGVSADVGMVGEKLVHDMKLKKEGVYSGRVWRPSNDKIYSGKMRLKGDASVVLKGCVAGGLICAGQIWTRVE